jgi:hypothetical protein
MSAFLELLTYLSICGLPLLAMVGALAWQVRGYIRSRRAGARLASGLGLEPLNQAADPLAIWYGGVFRGRQVTFKVCGRTERAYVGGEGTTSARFWLRLALALQLPVAPGIALVSEPKAAPLASPQTFDAAFTHEHADHLSPAAQTALLGFVRDTYRTRTGITSYRAHYDTRSLRLHDRATAPERLMLGSEVLPAARQILIHDHLNTSISIEQARALLDALCDVAHAVEGAARTDQRGDANRPTAYVVS